MKLTGSSLLADFVVGKFEMFQGFHFAKRVCGDDGDVVSVENQHFELCRVSQDGRPSSRVKLLEVKLR